MYKTLQPGCIGHGVHFKDAAEMAAKCGFEGYWFDIHSDSKAPVDETLELLEKYALRSAGFNLPVQFRQEEETFLNDLSQLKGYAEYAANIGAKRCITWITPGSNTLEYKDNFELHRSRLKKAAEILNEFDILFGLEFIGPLNSRKNAKYPFIHTLEQMLELCEAIGAGCGLLLDAWHWDTAGQKREDFNKITSPNQIVLVHINDAPAGIPLEEQVDSVRKLPGETGVLRIAEFFDGLQSAGYTGPVLAEPFEPKLREMTFEEALNTTMAAINKVWPK